MTAKLLTVHHWEFLSLKGGCIGSSKFTLVSQNATLLEITCHGSNGAATDPQLCFKTEPSELDWLQVCDMTH